MPSVPRRPLGVAMRRRVTLVVAPIVLAAFSVAAAPPASAAQHAVQIADSAFAPATVTVAAGGSVTWTNVDDRPHTATADGGAFDSGNLNSGQSFTTTFATPGTFTYICAYHPEMRATVVVTPAAAPAVPEAGAPTDAAVPTPVPPAEAAGEPPAEEAGPDTALPAPDSPPVAPALLAGLGLFSLAVAAVPGRRSATRTAPTGGWRR